MEWINQARVASLMRKCAGNDRPSFRIKDLLAIFCGVAIVCSYAYLNGLSSQFFQLGFGNADWEVDEIIFVTSLISIRGAVFAHRAHARFSCEP